MRPLKNVREPYASMTRMQLVDEIDRYAQNYNRLDKRCTNQKRQIAILEKRLENPNICKHGNLACIECERRCVWCGDDGTMFERDGARVCENCAYEHDEEQKEYATDGIL